MGAPKPWPELLGLPLGRQAPIGAPAPLNQGPTASCWGLNGPAAGLGPRQLVLMTQTGHLGLVGAHFFVLGSLLWNIPPGWGNI